jgi:SAM-dependent methyltransferase
MRYALWPRPTFDGNLDRVAMGESFNTKWFVASLRCPDCGSAMRISGRIECSVCEYSKMLDPPVDLRPSRPRRVPIDLPVVSTPPDQILKAVDIGKPQITYDGPPALRDSRELISEMMRSVQPNSRVLDLGCGPRDQARPIGHVGYQYVGVDISSPSADLLADAHSLPFRDSSFECIFSYAVHQHLYSPFIAIREIERVLSPGGIYIGTVSQGEPFNGSYFHHTTWGLASLTESCTAMRLSRLWCGPGTLKSLSRIGRYPRVVKMLLAAVDQIDTRAPWLAPRRQAWSKRDKQLDELYRAATICFVMEKANRVSP